MDNLISIIVPVYNVESYLRKCIESILNQTYKNLQIILVDDGSPDNSGAICDEYAAKDNRIEVVHKANGGVTSARKAGLELAKGDYIGFVDSDDWIEPNMYEEMLENLLQTGADFVHTGIVEEKNNIKKNIQNFEKRVIINTKNNIDMWKSYMYFHKKYTINSFLYSKLFKKDIIIPCFNNVSNDICYGEDRIAITECLLKNIRVSFLNKSYYHYVRRNNSYTSVHGAVGIIKVAKMYEEMIKLFRKYGEYDNLSDLIDAALNVRMLNEIANDPKYQNNVFIYRLEDLSNLIGKKIVIYGAGKVGYQYYRQLSSYSDITIMDWVDKNFSSYNYPERKVNSIDNLKNIDYDLIIIAVKYKEIAEQIMDELVAMNTMNIDKNKLRWYEPVQAGSID